MPSSLSSGSLSEEKREGTMSDVLFLVITVSLVWVSVIYTRRCDRI
jgi:hypothetical protein